jgi:hypothetical protein
MGGRSRRHAIAVLSAAFGASVVGACVRIPPSASGNRIVASPSAVVDERLEPRNWKTTRVRIGASVDALATLHFIQDLQMPSRSIPSITSMTFHAPAEVPFVTIGLYYERSGLTASVRDRLTSSALDLQQIADPHTAFNIDINSIQSAQQPSPTPTQIEWFSQHRQAIVDSMKYSAEGMMLSNRYDCDFTTRRRPPADTQSAIVVTGENPSGLQLEFTVIAQRITFVG